MFLLVLLMLVSCTDVTELVTSSLNKSLNLLLGNGSVIGNVTTRKTSPTDEYFRYFIYIGLVRLEICSCKFYVSILYLV